jgi:hypothetical protein
MRLPNLKISISIFIDSRSLQKKDFVKKEN